MNGFSAVSFTFCLRERDSPASCSRLFRATSLRTQTSSFVELTFVFFFALEKVKNYCLSLILMVVLDVMAFFFLSFFFNFFFNILFFVNWSEQEILVYVGELVISHQFLSLVVAVLVF